MALDQKPALPRGDILVVEAAPAARTYLSEILTQAGYEVRQATGGAMARQAVQLRRPELVLIAVEMPDADGAEVCRWLKAGQATADIPVIFISERNDAETTVRCLRLGAADCIGKPYHAEEVLARVETHLALARLRSGLEARVAERTEDLNRQRLEMESVLAALEIAGDGIAIVDAENRLSHVNRSMAETLGLDCVTEMIGRRSEELLADGRTLFKADELKTAREQARHHGRWQGELSLTRPGLPKPGKLLAHFRELPDGGRVAVVTDITESRQREEERRRLEQQLEQARKLESLGQLTASVAHDFNNLLGAILGFAQFIVEDTGDESPLHRYATRILRAGNQAKTLITQILSFSHRRDIACEPVNLNVLIGENMGILKAIVAPTTSLSFLPHNGTPFLSGQGSQIMQMLVNLVGNASEALNGREGEVVVEARAVDAVDSGLVRHFPRKGEEDEVRSNAWSDDDGIHHAALGCLHAGCRYLCLSVTDSGDGMPEDVAARIFEPFFTTKSKSGGTGLGLAVVHDIVISHQAGMLLSTAPGHGTRFDIYFPIMDAEGMELTELSPTLPIAHKGSILLVDDSSDFGDMLMTALFRLGYEISVCDDPVDAIGYVREDPSAWDMVITDQIMPQMSGSDLVAAVKQVRPDLPCIICTAVPNGLTEEAARCAGADGLATKPLDIGEFSVMVKDLMGRPQSLF